jgi:hypothetical protein
VVVVVRALFLRHLLTQTLVALVVLELSHL